MQHLTAKDYAEIKKAIISYNSLNEDDQKIIRSHIDEIWFHVYDEYSALCHQDPEWVQLNDQIKDYEQATSITVTDNDLAQKNIDDYISGKLTQINHKKFVFGKVNDAEKQKTSTAPYQSSQAQINTISRKYATEVICQELKQSPGIACVEHNSYIKGTEYSADSSVLNDVCNEIRDEALGIIVNDTKHRPTPNDDELLQ